MERSKNMFHYTMRFCKHLTTLLLEFWFKITKINLVKESFMINFTVLTRSFMVFQIPGKTIKKKENELKMIIYL